MIVSQQEMPDATGSQEFWQSESSLHGETHPESSVVPELLDVLVVPELLGVVPPAPPLAIVPPEPAPPLNKASLLLAHAAPIAHANEHRKTKDDLANVTGVC